MATAPVLLVSMPWGDLDRPSIQVGLLKAIAREHGFAAETFHAYLHLASRLGPATYRRLCDRWGRLIGDWLFSLEAFGDRAPDSENELLDVVRSDLDAMGKADRAPEFCELLLTIRHEHVPAFLDEAYEQHDWAREVLVGFTSTFQQNGASIALARRIKSQHPDVLTLFGGANLEGEMGREFVRAIEVADFAISGEADLAFPRLLAALATGGDPRTVPGIIYRNGDGGSHGTEAEPFAGLDSSPVPDYDEYFSRAEQLGLLEASGHRRVALPFESARGCWWGQKHHCTFCGLNGSIMAYRSKSGERVKRELASLAQRYRSFSFVAVDNILSTDHLRRMLPELIEEQSDYELFYEVKANLTRAQLHDMARAGLRRMQPGIESLSSHSLKLMDKGVSAAQNVNVLRWAHYYGIEVAWNVLWGFPGETEEDCRVQAELCRRLVHLPPPSSAARIWMQRFSPIFVDRERFPLRWMAAERAYAFVYPPEVDVEKLAYFFEYELDGTLPEDAYAELSAAATEWLRSWEEGDTRPQLTFWSAPGYVQIHDGRRPETTGTYALEDPYAAIYKACSERPIGLRALREKLGLDLSEEDVEVVVDEFTKRGLMMRDGSQALTLALPAVGGR